MSHHHPTLPPPADALVQQPKAPRPSFESLRATGGRGSVLREEEAASALLEVEQTTWHLYELASQLGRLARKIPGNHWD
jgi:hypothetical protein